MAQATAQPPQLSLLEPSCPIQVEHDRKRRQFTVRLNGNKVNNANPETQRFKDQDERKKKRKGQWKKTESQEEERGKKEARGKDEEEYAEEMEGEEEEDELGEEEETHALHQWTALHFPAALDFVVEEDLKAHLTCWYIQKYVKENPLPQYLERLQS
ncbi:hypothetical protein JD844_019920 [Phrynosoma platyrhinos]|uniref:Uncharacterized protein n=1 Tax=Phrynosoma platyrhinos TaxID=52577 RepID=A0ABQ7TRC5_PHRPL|nr:hypothetical protein JD844_019920 [Phrynosoma platyrhinos]